MKLYNGFVFLIFLGITLQAHAQPNFEEIPETDRSYRSPAVLDADSSSESAETQDSLEDLELRSTIEG